MSWKRTSYHSQKYENALPFILTLSLEVIAVVPVTPRRDPFPDLSTKHNLPPLEQITNKTYHWQHIVVVPRSNEINELSINCDQILRHGNKDVKENTIIIPWNIYGFVLITNFVVNSFLRGLIAHQWWMVYIVDRWKS